MSHQQNEQSLGGQQSLRATYMRGGTSKGVFFLDRDLPEHARTPCPALERIFLSVIGSPDPYGKHIDGMGGASSSTSKCVVVGKSSRADHDVNYLYGQVAIDQAFVDWSGNCGNLSSAVGPFAIKEGLLDPARVPRDGICVVRIWQANIGKTIIAHVPMRAGKVQELGDFELDGVTFPAAEIALEFIDPAEEGEGGSMFPSGRLVDQIESDDFGRLPVTLINSGIPTAFFNAVDLRFDGSELQPAVNGDESKLQALERLRARAALAMGLIKHLDEAKSRQHTPKLAWVAPARAYLSSSGRQLAAADMDLSVRALSMGKLHHAMMATCAVAIATAAAIPGTLVNTAAGGGVRHSVRFGHPSGLLRVGAEAVEEDGVWRVKRALMSRSARILMSGEVHFSGAPLSCGVSQIP
jgi:hypothetical protein